MPNGAILQLLLILALIVVLCIVMSRVLTVPEKCRTESRSGEASAECLQQFPQYPPKPAN